VPASSRAAIEIARGHDGDARRRALANHARQLRARVGRPGAPSESPIAPVLVATSREVMERTARLLARGLYVAGHPAADRARRHRAPPREPEAAHTSAQVEQLVDACVIDSESRWIHRSGPPRDVAPFTQMGEWERS